MATNYIAYCRVSTQKQGLGLDAQMSTINNYVNAHGGKIVNKYSEKESGKDTENRDELNNAIAECKQNGYTLIVAKLDRLSRDIMDIFAIKKMKNLKFEVCDCDASDTLTLGIFATLAQKERELISKRTKEALAIRKIRGEKLGNPNLTNKTAKGISLMKANQAKIIFNRMEKANTNKANLQAYAVIKDMNGSLRDKAKYLNDYGFQTSTGKPFTATQVMRLIKRFAK